MRRHARRARPAFVLVLGLAAALASACTKHDALILIELRVSGPLGAPIAGVRLSAPGWPTRTVSGGVGAQGFRVGYYGPANGSAVTVTAEALDDEDCVRGRGSAGVPPLAEGATSVETRLYIRPTRDSGCVMMDAGTDAGVEDAGTDAGVDDAGTDAGVDDAGTDAGVDATDDAGTDADVDATDDAGTGSDASNDTNAD